MLFNSIQFLLFFPIMVLGYYLLPQRVRWVWLLAGSYFFYMSWSAGYILLILASTLVDFIAAKRIHKTEKEKSKKHWLWLSLAVNLGLLFTFKYFNFFSTNLFAFVGLFTEIQPTPLLLNVLLPVGISFYTFQTISYTLDVYYGRIEPEKHLGKFALYVSFFPQLVAGPIERAHNLLPQLDLQQKLKYENISVGFKMMAWGFFKKVVIADNIATYVDLAYGNSSNGTFLLMATVLFGFQIYCDFSGYSDIAIGAARMMGINLMENFRLPFFSQSIREYWTRWHISLYTWLNDYVYNPIAISFRSWGKRGIILAIFLTFVISGVWHGANWTYIAWGTLHGIGVAAALAFPLKKAKTQFRRVLNILGVFVFLQFTWVLFRAENLNHAAEIFRGIFTWNDSGNNLTDLIVTGVLYEGKMAIDAAMLLVFLLSDSYLDKLIKQRVLINYKPLSYLIFGIILTCILLFGYWGESKFIYFQF